MARAPDDLGEARLASLKAVSGGYPLRGQLTLGDLLADGRVQTRGPAPMGAGGWRSLGGPWFAPCAQPQDGRRHLAGRRPPSASVRSLSTSLTAAGLGFSAFSPRVLMREADLPATELIQPASRVTIACSLPARPAVGTQVRPNLKAAPAG